MGLRRKLEPAEVKAVFADVEWLLVSDGLGSHRYAIEEQLERAVLHVSRDGIVVVLAINNAWYRPVCRLVCGQTAVMHSERGVIEQQYDELVRLIIVSRVDDSLISSLIGFQPERGCQVRRSVKHGAVQLQHVIIQTRPRYESNWWFGLMDR